jgi:hypothetical protein
MMMRPIMEAPLLARTFARLDDADHAPPAAHATPTRDDGHGDGNEDDGEGATGLPDDDVVLPTFEPPPLTNADETCLRRILIAHIELYVFIFFSCYSSSFHVSFHALCMPQPFRCIASPCRRCGRPN